MPLSKIKVLLLNVNRKGWHSGNMIYDMEAVQRACDTVCYGPGWPNYKNNDIVKIIKQVYGDGKPDVIYSYFTEGERIRDCYVQQYQIPQELRVFHTNLKSVTGVAKIFALSDFWARRPEQYSKDLMGSTYRYCFSCFTPPYSNPDHFYAFFSKDLRKEIEFIGYPRCVDKDCFKDYGLPKKYDVVTVGAMWHFYSMRAAMHNYLATHQEMGISYKNYPHCGTDFIHNDFVRDKYAKAINESKMLLSCGGRFHVAFNKIFEAMGCMSAYVGERPYGEQELHMKDGENYIAVTLKDFRDKIKYYLDNENKLKDIIKNGNDTFLKYHHIDARAGDFVKLLESIL